MKKYLLSLVFALVILFGGMTSVYAYAYEDGSAIYPFQSYWVLDSEWMTAGETKTAAFYLDYRDDYLEVPVFDAFGNIMYYDYAYESAPPVVTGCVSTDPSVINVVYDPAFPNQLTYIAGNPGSATIILTYGYAYSNGILVYYQTEANVYVEPKPLTNIYDCEITLSKTTYNYSEGKIYTPSVKVVSDAGMKLTEGVDYTVSYEKNKNYGVGRVIIKGIGDYQGYKVEKFGITPKKVKNVKVKSPFKNEATVTWSKVDGADGFYVYRKKSGGEYKYIANITDGTYQVFHDIGLKAGESYAYKIVPYVKDDYYDEDVYGYTYEKPIKREQDNCYFDGYTYYFYPEYNWMEYEDTTSYYSKKAAKYALLSLYDYSCIKGRCKLAFESSGYGKAAGKVTSEESGKKIPIYVGEAHYDYMIYLLNKEIVKGNMNDEQKVKAIFDWMAKNCEFTKDVKDYSLLSEMKQYINYTSPSFEKKAKKYEKKIQQQIKTGAALCSGTGQFRYDRGLVALAYRKGSCSYLTPMFNMLCNVNGIEAYTVSGDYVESSGDRQEHNFSFVRLGDKYYWYDTPIAVRHPNSKSYVYKKGTDYFKKHHDWPSYSLNGFDKKMFVK